MAKLDGKKILCKWCRLLTHDGNRHSKGNDKA